MKREEITDLNVLRVLRVSASTGSMATAAAQLEVKPEAVRARMKGLEKRLRKKVLKRTTRHCQITDEGKALLENYIQLLQDEIEKTKQFLHPKETKASPLSKPGARFEISLRCAEDGQWVALSNAPEVVFVSAELTDAIQRMTQEMIKSVTS
jgi:molybdenum-dependent DNA-binding transcriptional regulator ModE